MVELELVKRISENKIFYRFNVDKKVRFWFDVTNGEDIYRVTTEIINNSFSFSKLQIYICTGDSPFWVNEILISTPSLTGSGKFIERCISELMEADKIASQIELFFKFDFKEKYLSKEK